MDAEKNTKPVYLLADSQLLFWKPDSSYFLESLLPHLPDSQIRAAYIGASNGDQPEFYAIFDAAMENIGIRERRMIPAAPSEADVDFLNSAHLILLAGGDPIRGWRAFQQNGLDETILKKYYDGALLIGLSAGALQLGLYAYAEALEPGAGDPENIVETFKLIPFTIGAHDEANRWKRLRQILESKGGILGAVGIPTGGGMIYHNDHTLEPIRHPVDEYNLLGGQVTHNIIFPLEQEQIEN